MSHTLPRLLVRTVLPAEEPLTLAEAKLYLRVDGSSEDALIVDAMQAAREMAEMYMKRSLITQSWKLAYDDALPDETFLPYGPIISVTNVKIFDEEENETTVNTTIYSLNAAKTTLILESQVWGHRVEVNYQAGYGDASAVPKPIKQGILLHIAAMYDERSSSAVIPDGARALYASYREVRL